MAYVKYIYFQMVLFLLLLTGIRSQGTLRTFFMWLPLYHRQKISQPILCTWSGKHYDIQNLLKSKLYWDYLLMSFVCILQIYTHTHTHSHVHRYLCACVIFLQVKIVFHLFRWQGSVQQSCIRQIYTNNWWYFLFLI